MIPNIGEYGGVLLAPDVVFLDRGVRNVSPRLEANQAREVCGKVRPPLTIELVEGIEGRDQGAANWGPESLWSRSVGVHSFLGP